MIMFAGLDIGGKRTAICVIDESGKAIWRGTVDTHPEMIDGALQRFKGSLDKVGLESGPFTPHLFRSLEAMGYPMICMDARRAADAIKSRRIKSDKGDAWALAEMLRTGWFSSVYVKSVDTHRLKALLGARDQLVKLKRSLGNQVRGLLRPSASDCRRGRAERSSTRRPILRRRRIRSCMRRSGLSWSLWPRSKGSRRGWTTNSTSLQSAMKSPGG